MVVRGLTVRAHGEPAHDRALPRPRFSATRQRRALVCPCAPLARAPHLSLVFLHPLSADACPLLVCPQVERMAFYERSKKAFAIVATGETALYGNLILKKGVIGTSK